MGSYEERARIKQENKEENERKRLEKIEKKKERKKKHEALLAEHKRLKELKVAARAAKEPQRQAQMSEDQGKAIKRHQREVELQFDITSMEEQIREMLSEHGEIESVKKTIKGGLLIRFATAEAATNLLATKKETTINATLTFPVTPVVIKQHSMYYKPEFVIDQEVLNATAEYFSSISVVQQVKKLRNAVLIVFEDTTTRDQMVERSKEESWEILGRPIGLCHAGLPAPVNKRKARAPPPKKKKKTLRLPRREKKKETPTKKKKKKKKKK